LSGATVELRGVTKRYGGTLAVDELSFTVPAGRICVLVGPSGCGKTTSLRMVNRLIEPTSGEILIDGQNVLREDPVVLRRRIGYVIQQVGLFPHQTVGANIATVPQLLGWSRERIRARVDELLALIGLDRGMKERYPAQLSGGERQRVGVARAMAAEPPLMLMDEPFGAVDPIVRERLQNEFLQLQRAQGITVIFVTHDIDEAIKLADRIAVMNQGRLEQYDTPAAILARPASDLVIDLLGPDRGLKRLTVTPIDLSELEHPPIVRVDESLAGARSRVDSQWRRVVVLDRNDRLVGELDREGAQGEASVRDRLRPIDATVGADQNLYDAFSQMLIHHADWVAVLDGDRFCGILTPASFVAAIQRVPAEMEGARR